MDIGSGAKLMYALVLGLVLGGVVGQLARWAHSRSERIGIQVLGLIVCVGLGAWIVSF